MSRTTRENATFSAALLKARGTQHILLVTRLQQITGKAVLCQRGSVADVALVQSLIEQHGVVAVVHFAGFKAVGESCVQALDDFVAPVAAGADQQKENSERWRA